MKHGRISRTLAILLAALMIGSALVACAKNGGGDGTTAAGTPASTTGTPSASTDDQSTPEETKRLDEFGREWIDDELPESAALDRTFTVHMRGNVEQYEWKAEDINGETLNDAIYKRNTNVENRFGITLNVIAEGNWKNYGENLEKVKNSIKTGDGTYDLLCGYSTPMASMATTGLIRNLNKLDNIHLEKPWWSDSWNRDFMIGDKLYFGVGSLSIAMIYSMECIFYNTDIMKEVDENYNIYKTVLNQAWTWDEMNKVGALAYDDANGNQVPDFGDRFGFASAEASNSGNTINGLLYSTGFRLVQKDESGTPKLTEDIARLVTIGEKEVALLYNTPSNYNLSNSAKLDFTAGNMLFCHYWLYYGQTNFSKVMDNYGIVPMPKFDTDQEDYCTPVQGGMHMYAIPIDVDAEEDSMLTEAFAAESYRVLLPAYYEVVLKTRYAPDAYTSQMIDIMYDTVIFDIGMTYNGSIGYLNSYKDAIASGANITSSMSRQASAAKRNLEMLVTGILEVQDKD